MNPSGLFERQASRPRDLEQRVIDELTRDPQPRVIAPAAVACASVNRRAPH